MLYSLAFFYMFLSWFNIAMFKQVANMILACFDIFLNNFLDVASII